jgi:type VI secretion system secreted protein VgrG
MPSPKSGSPGTVVAPAEPEVAEEADNSKPGEVEEVKGPEGKPQPGKSSSAAAKPFKPPQTQKEKEKKKSWIAIKMLDEEGKPVPGEKYRVKLPDGSVQEGTLGADGTARVEGFEPGSCEVTFSELDEGSWKPQ